MSKAIDHLVDDTRSALHWFAELTGTKPEDFHDVGGFFGAPARCDSFYLNGTLAFSLIQASDLHHDGFVTDRVSQMHPAQVAAHGVTRHAVLILCDTPEELEAGKSVASLFPGETHVLWVNDDESVIPHAV
jgi:hypothetical protein